MEAVFIKTNIHNGTTTMISCKDVSLRELVTLNGFIDFILHLLFTVGKLNDKLKDEDKELRYKL